MQTEYGNYCIVNYLFNTFALGLCDSIIQIHMHNTRQFNWIYVIVRDHAIFQTMSHFLCYIGLFLHFEHFHGRVYFYCYWMRFLAYRMEWSRHAIYVLQFSPSFNLYCNYEQEAISVHLSTIYSGGMLVSVVNIVLLGERWHFQEEDRLSFCKLPWNGYVFIKDVCNCMYSKNLVIHSMFKYYYTSRVRKLYTNIEEVKKPATMTLTNDYSCSHYILQPTPPTPHLLPIRNSLRKAATRS